MSPVKVPANLPDLVRSTFNKAKANGDVNFYPTQVAILTPTASIPFQLRFSPSLANKPKPPPSSSAEKKKPVDPFESPPPALTIAPIEPDHVLVLNKFAVVPEHFILITREFKLQTDLLDAADLAAVYACIQAYHASDTEGGEGQELFAFFNSGEHSGASQPHRHVQLLPVARMRDGLDGGGGGGSSGSGWDVLANKLAEPPADGATGEKPLPFATFAARLRPGASAPSELRAVYLSLYRRACAAAGAGAEGDGNGDGGSGAARISYNLVVTRDAMVLCPRLAEGDVVRDARGDEVGRLALNGTVLAGTALVKTEQEWDALRGDGGEQLWRILGKIGVPVAS